MSHLILCFLEIPKIFICVYVRQVVSFIWELQKLSVWRSVLFTVFALEMRERETNRKQTGSNVYVLLKKASALAHDRFI